jgi:Tfp pilus assembly protein PilO
MNLASSTRTWTIGGVLAIVVVLALGFFLGIQPQLQAADLAQRQLIDVEAQNDLARLELEALKQQFELLPEITAELDALRLSIPATASIDEFTTQLAGQLAATGVTLVTFTASPGASFIPSPQVVERVPPGVDATNFVTIPFQLSAVGPRDGIIAFIAGIQDGRRLAVVDQFTMLNSGDFGAIAVDLSGLLYVLLDEPIVVGGEVPADGTTPTEPVDPAAG